MFKGLGMGIGDSRNSGGATWTVPLTGLEKKLEDITLINAPFVDGDTLQDVGDYLADYAGLVPDYTFANPAVQLGATDDINAVRFDWKAGTSLKQALDEVMADVVHWYVVRDGKIYFYELDGLTGLPTTGLGTDWEPTYPSVKIVMFDATPDFEDLRNQVVVMGLKQTPDGQIADIANLPSQILIAVKKGYATTPDVPWARILTYPVPSYGTMAKFTTLAERLAARYSIYELLGKTSIPGNAKIRPYDQWGDFVIFTVTQNMDFKAKTWTTDLEFMKKTR
jgi:hypothetical protein